MAVIRQRGERYQVVFSYGNSPQWVRSCGEDQVAALLKKQEVELVIDKLHRGYITVPSDCEDIGEFIWHGGKVTKPVAGLPMTLGEVLAAYRKSSHFKSLAENSRYTIGIHCPKLEKILGKQTPLRSLKSRDLQRYIDTRREEGVVGGTAKAELTTLRTMWNLYALPQEIVDRDWRSAFPHRLNFGKLSEKPPFQTYDEIAAQVSKDAKTGLPDATSELWASLWLQRDELEELLALMKKRHGQPEYSTVHGWVYPAVAFAYYTTFRKSTIQRALVRDVDFKREQVSGRIKKEEHARDETLRTVPMHSKLIPILKDWLKSSHPGGKYLFCNISDVQLTSKQLGMGLEIYLRGTKWAVIAGWHTFRHSAVSAMADAGLTMDTINEFSGHHSPEMQRRYRHKSTKSIRNEIEKL